MTLRYNEMWMTTPALGNMKHYAYSRLQRLVKGSPAQKGGDLPVFVKPVRECGYLTFALLLLDEVVREYDECPVAIPREGGCENQNMAKKSVLTGSLYRD